jgi:hypothetical protein
MVPIFQRIFIVPNGEPTADALCAAHIRCNSSSLDKSQTHGACSGRVDPVD